MRTPFVAGILLLMSAAAGAEPAKPLTLADCYQRALRQSEEIAVHAEQITETEGRFMQSLSGILPKVSFSSLDKWQDGSGSSAFTRKRLPERKFTFSQPLFSGFKEFAAMKGANLERHQREFEKARAEQLLGVDVSDSFHLLLEQREDLRAANAIRQTLQDRIAELKERERLGRSRSSEVVAAQAQLYRVEAEWELIQSRETVASQLLQFLTGLSAVGELEDPGPILPVPAPEPELLARAVERPDVRAAEKAAQIARQQIRVAQAKFFPVIGTGANYYVERSGAAEEVKWDTSLTVEVPLFQGGAAVGATKEAQSGARQADLRLAEARRRASQEIRDAYAQYDGARGRVWALTLALEAVEENYQLQVQEYRRNLVSNLEVLSSLEDLQDARRELIAALYESRRLYWKLQSAAGETLL